METILNATNLSTKKTDEEDEMELINYLSAMENPYETFLCIQKKLFSNESMSQFLLKVSYIIDECPFLSVKSDTIFEKLFAKDARDTDSLATYISEYNLWHTYFSYAKKYGNHIPIVMKKHILLNILSKTTDGWISFQQQQPKHSTQLFKKMLKINPSAIQKMGVSNSTHVHHVENNNKENTEAKVTNRDDSSTTSSTDSHFKPSNQLSIDITESVTSEFEKLLNESNNKDLKHFGEKYTTSSPLLKNLSDPSTRTRKQFCSWTDAKGNKSCVNGKECGELCKEHFNEIMNLAEIPVEEKNYLIKQYASSNLNNNDTGNK